MAGRGAKRILENEGDLRPKAHGHAGQDSGQTDLQPFNVGRQVLHPAHGLGEIVALEKTDIGGESIELLVINFPADKLTLRVPKAKAASLGVRTLPEPAVGAAPPLAPAPRAQPEFLEELHRHGFSDDELFDLVIPRRTLARRRVEGDLLTVEETDKALRLMRIATQAEKVFGEDAKAYRWLRKPKRELSGETPVAFLASESGARLVEEMLCRIEHGIFA